MARGETLQWWVQHNSDPESRFFGFDTFEGLPEDWVGKRKGSFSAEGRAPDISDPRCHFEVGLFAETLDGFLEREALRHPMVVHLDADLYTSTQCVFEHLGSRFAVGDVLIFDEIGAPRAMTSEFRAWDEFVRATGTRARILAGAKNLRVLALEILEPPAKRH